MIFKKKYSNLFLPFQTPKISDESSGLGMEYFKLNPIGSFTVMLANKLLTMLFIAGFLVGCRQETNKPQWFLKATYHESCSCNAPCPCPFGLPMTNSYCKLNSLLEIHSGRFDSVDLKGVRVVLSGSVGKWGEYYFSESTSQEQKLALETILNKVNVGYFDTVLTSKMERIDFKNENGTVSFSTPTIQVKMSMVKGNNEQPVVIQNLKGRLFENYIPHLSSVNQRFFADTTHNFSFEKKAGFISSWDLTDEDFN